MGYTLNFTLIWRHFDRLWGGLLLSLELALFSILIGIVIGLALAILHVSGGRITRTLIAAYVEFIRNVPLILLVYLVFYGLPTVIDLSYDATTSFVVTCQSIRALTWWRCSAQVLRPCRAASRTPAGDWPHPVAAAPVRAAADHASHHASGTVQHLHLPVQGHVGGLGHRGPGTDLRSSMD